MNRTYRLDELVRSDILENTFLVKEEALFLHGLTTRQYFNYVLFRALFLIDSNKGVFPDSVTPELLEVENYLKTYSENFTIFRMSSFNFHKFSEIVAKLHSKVIWNKFKNEKERIVYSIRPKFEFMLEVHNLFRLVRTKIIDSDLSLSFAPYQNINYVVKKGRYQVPKLKSEPIVRKGYYHLSSFVEQDRKILTGCINYFNKHCCYGLRKTVHEAVATHANPDNMVVFDIAKFFPSFSLEKIRSNRLFESNYEILMYNLNKNRKKRAAKISLSSEYKENAELFYSLFNAFSYNGLLPTGSIFASDISNLLFFSVDMKISNLLHSYYASVNIKKKESSVVDGNGTTVNLSSAILRASEHMDSGSTPILRYTRYVDDIGISVDLRSPITASSFRRDNPLKDVEKYFIGMNLIKEVEKVLNQNGFFIKYEKTKIFSYKMSKTYLGFNYTPKKLRARNGGGPKHYIGNTYYTISYPSDKRYDLNKRLYDTIKRGEKVNHLFGEWLYATGTFSSYARKNRVKFTYSVPPIMDIDTQFALLMTMKPISIKIANLKNSRRIKRTYG